MIQGLKIDVFVDYKRLTQEASDLTANRVSSWRLLLKEYGSTKVINRKTSGGVSNENLLLNM